MDFFHMRQGISYTVNVLSQFMHSPNIDYLQVSHKV